MTLDSKCCLKSKALAVDLCIQAVVYVVFICDSQPLLRGLQRKGIGVGGDLCNNFAVTSHILSIYH